jgi:hypothetical protein
MITNHYSPIPYRPARLPCRAVTLLAALVAAAALGGVLVSAGTVPEAGRIDSLSAAGAGRIALAVAQAGFWAASVAALLWWLASAYRNLPALGAVWPKFTPATAVGWWFVPVANLVRPLEAILEVWRASDPTRLRPEGYAVPESKRWMPAAWWAAFVLGAVAVATGVWAAIGLGPGPVQRVVLAASHGVVLASAGATLWLVRRLTRWQERHWGRIVADALAHHAACLDPVLQGLRHAAAGRRMPVPMPAPAR